MNLLQQITCDAYNESEALGLPRSASHRQRMEAISVLRSERDAFVDAKRIIREIVHRTPWTPTAGGLALLISTKQIKAHQEFLHEHE